MCYSLNSPEQATEFHGKDKCRNVLQNSWRNHLLARAVTSILGGINLQVSNDHSGACKILSISNCVTDTISAAYVGDVDHVSFIQASGRYQQVEDYDYFSQKVPGMDDCIYEDIIQDLFIYGAQHSRISWLKLITSIGPKQFPSLSEQERVTLQLAYLVRVVLVLEVWSRN